MVLRASPRPGVQARHSPSTSRQCVLNDLPFMTGVLIGVRGLRLLRQADSTGIPGQPGCIRAQYAIRTHNDRPLNHILQFANIARPGVLNERIHSRLRYLLDLLPHAPGKKFDKMRDQRRNILPALAQWWQHDRKYIETVIQVTAEFVSCDHLGKIAMGRCHQTDVDAVRAAASQTVKLLLTCRIAQQLRLQTLR